MAQFTPEPIASRLLLHGRRALEQQDRLAFSERARFRMDRLRGRRCPAQRPHVRECGRSFQNDRVTQRRSIGAILANSPKRGKSRRLTVTTTNRERAKKETRGSKYAARDPDATALS